MNIQRIHGPTVLFDGWKHAKTTGRTNLLIASGFQHEAPSDVVSFPAEIHNKSAKPNSDILICIYSMTDEEAYRSTEIYLVFSSFIQSWLFGH